MPRDEGRGGPSPQFLRDLAAAFQLLGYAEMGWDGATTVADIAAGLEKHAARRDALPPAPETAEAGDA